MTRTEQTGSSTGVTPAVEDFHSVIHQATGMVVVQAGVSPSMALLLLVTFADEAEVSLDAVAHDVVNRVHSFDVNNRGHKA
jgi:hypothetical protein